MPDHVLVRFCERGFRRLLLVYPKTFRAELGDDLLDAHRDRCRDEWEQRGWLGLTAYWTRTSARMLHDGIGERLAALRSRSRRPRRYVLDSVRQDLRFAFRSLMNKPGFSAVIVLTLALGIGVNAAIFSIVDGVLLRSLPYPNPAQLVRLWETNTQADNRFVELSFADYAYIRDNSSSFTATAAFSQASRDLVDAYGNPTEIVIGRVVDGLFSLFGVSPILGRDFLPDDTQRGVPVVILSHALWQARYGSDPSIIGKTVHIRAQPFTVVGVLPHTSGYPLSADVWRPLIGDNQDEDREFHVIARLAQGVSVAQASAEIRVLAAQLEAAEPDLNENISAWVQPMQAMLVRNARTPLLILLGAVAFVLLIACANVANLLMARGTTRQQEVAVRTALGASRSRIVRQLLTESLLLALLGGGAGLLAGYWALDTILAISPQNTPRLAEVALDGRIVAAMTVISVITGAVFGLLPALQASRPDLHANLKAEGRAQTGNVAVRRVQRGLVITEVALTTVLAIGAGLLITSFSRMLHLERGFATENVLLVPVEPGTLHLERNAIALFDDVLERVRPLPGVQSAVLSTMNPMAPRGLTLSIQIATDPDPRIDLPRVRWHSTSPDFFSVVGIPLQAGRFFDDRDNETAPRVILINQAFADAHFGGDDPIGKQLSRPAVEIVGVVGNVTPLAESVPRPTMYSPFRQQPWPGAYVVVRSATDPLPLAEAIRQQIWAVDATIPLDDITTVELAIAETVASPRFHMLLVGVFALLALVLAGVGIYGVMSYAVNQRTRELGLRQALGAADGDLLGMVMRQGLAMALAGIMSGLVAAFWLTRLLSTLLYDVAPTDPRMFAGVALLLTTVAAAACFFPARRATLVDPMVALRYE